jgi:FkbM family methyltransferase
LRQFVGACGALFLRHPGIKGKTRIFLTYAWLSVRKRLRPPRASTRILGHRVHFGDFDLFHHTFEEVFVRGDYAVDLDHDQPRIIDAGANVGLATLYFKYRYPDAVIDCFEPNGANFNLLVRNIHENRLADVRPRKVALGANAGTGTLYTRHDVSGGDLAASFYNLFEIHGQAEEFAVDGETVEVAPLTSFIEDEVDLLKIDVEGAEAEALEGAGEKLRNVQHVVIEYHRLPNNQPLSRVLALLEASGHCYEIRKWWAHEEPWLAYCMVTGELRAS